MAKSVPALMNPALLVWARESIGYEVEEVAHHLDVPGSSVSAWERGDERPTVVQLRLLADLYERPLAIFYLPNVPRAFDPMRYFRRRPDEAKPAPSPRMAVQIRDAEARREAALELAETLGDVPAALTLRASLGEQPGIIAARAREWLDVSLETQASWRDEFRAYQSWRAALERAGALVFQLSVDEHFRGFSIDAERYPVIAVNSKDTPRARIFTLFHELGHLVLGQGELDEGGFWTRTEAVEVFCNEFAGQLLVPAEALDAELGVAGGGASEVIDRDAVDRLLPRFWVSEEVILLRLVNTGRLARSAYEARRAELRTYPLPKRYGRMEPPKRTVQALGQKYVRSVLLAFDGQHITMSDVAGYLGVKLKHLPEIERLVALGGGA
jgi:Zn-dependent peptidase ImmA (M78 family)